MWQLDHFSDKLLKIFKTKGGLKGHKIKEALAISDSASASEDAKRDMANTVMGIYTLQRDVDGQPEDVGIVIEGNIVMDNLGSVIVGFVMLLGHIYALDLSFPDKLKHTFEFMQKVVMNLDGHKLNGKIESLKIKLLD
ncbi:hypothetical protein JOQ06_029265 [Pogonophryne albipinna]|uniref:Uncharacterized protein n=1 Tax=Pogonophryne albipinna TaxID=1090488 RepID=A0AAD6B9M3_9TELE|nr:hypothetical protein JOQ06_029265 [Pogonophryne albipinna]